MDVFIRNALTSWQNPLATNVARISDSVVLTYDRNNTTGFSARAQFELPDGGRFSIALSGTCDSSMDTITTMVEDGLCLPDGFIIDINSFIFNQLNDRRPSTPKVLIDCVLLHASSLFDKLVTDVAKKASEQVNPNAMVAPLADAANLKRKRHSYTNLREPEFGTSRLATTTLMKQISLLQDMDTRKDGFTAIPVEDDLYCWKVHLYFDDNNCSMAKDLAKIPGHDSVELEFRFPQLYPDVPPVVRVISPYISGGHVAPHGGICMELLTTSGWAPVNSIDVVCIQIRTMLLHGQARVDPKKMSNLRNYTFEGAMRDMRHIVRIHHWDVPDSRVSRRRTMPS